MFRRRFQPQPKFTIDESRPFGAAFFWTARSGRPLPQLRQGLFDSDAPPADGSSVANPVRMMTA